MFLVSSNKSSLKRICKKIIIDENNLWDGDGDPIDDLKNFADEIKNASGLRKKFVLTRKEFDFYVEKGLIHKQSKEFKIIEEE